MTEDLNETRETLAKSIQQLKALHQKYKDMVQQHKAEKAVVMEKMNEYKKKTEQAEQESSQAKGLISLSDSEKVERIQTLQKQMSHLDLLYRNLSSEKTAMYREVQQWKRTAEAKKEKLKLTKQQHEQTIRQLAQEIQKNQKFGEFINKFTAMIDSKDQIKRG